MAVRVRLFAAVRDAAGTAETTVEPGPLPVLLDELRARYPEPFPARLAVCTVLVDGDPAAPDAGVEVADGAEIALLPPFSGGGGEPGGEPWGGVPGARSGGPPVTTVGVAAVAGLATVVALVAGPQPFAVVVVVFATLLLVDLSSVLGAAGPRPVVLAAAVPGVGLPVLVALRPDQGWTATPGLVAGGLLATFLVVLVFGRRHDVTDVLGATMLGGLVVGLGTGGLLLLRSLPDGFPWTLGVVAVVVTVEVVRQVATARMESTLAAGATVAAAFLTGGVLLTVADPPFTLAATAGVTAVALLATATAGLVRESLDDALAATAADRGTRLPPGAGVLTTVALPVLLAAPAAYAIARLAAV